MAQNVYRRDRKLLVLSLFTTAVGVGGLLMATGVSPQVDWIWSLGLGTMGLIVFVLSGGIDKASVVLGPIFLLAAVLSVLRQSGRLTAAVEVPLLVTALGVLMFLAHLPVVPLPSWLRGNEAVDERPAD